MTPRYRLQHVVRRYRPTHEAGVLEALRVPHLEVTHGEILAIVGPNGSGKSTLLETMAFLAKPDDGRVLLDGRDVWADGESLAARRRCPLLLQRTILFKTSVVQNVMYGLRARGMGRAAARSKAEHVLQRIGLRHLAHRTHRELSGGERQLVALARVLAIEPDTLLLDEPTAHIDHDNAQRIDDIIEQLHRTTGATVIVASHDGRPTALPAHRVVTLLDGQLIPGPLHNLFAGTLRRHVDAPFHFDGEPGPRFTFDTAAVVPEDQAAVASRLDTAVRMAIDPDRIAIVMSEKPGATLGRGYIEAVDQQRDRCRVVVRLETGQRIQVALTTQDYLRLGINISLPVYLHLADHALRLIPPQKRTAETRRHSGT